MKIKGIQQIRDISDYASAKLDIKIKKMSQRYNKTQLKQIKCLIKKLHKKILKTAQKGNYHIHYDRQWLTQSQIYSIKNYFTEMGYTVDIIEYESPRVKPLIEISWERKIVYENESHKIS